MPLATSRLTQLVFDRLPDYVQAADTLTDDTTRRYLAALLDPSRRLVELIDATDPATSTTGTCEIVSAEHAASSWLNWLGWLLGVNVSALADSDKRAALIRITTTQRRGSAGAIADAVKRTLTGSKSVRVYHNLSGTDPYLITVITLASQTPNESAALLAAFTEAPAGCSIELQVVLGTTYADLQANFDTYDTLTTAFDTYADAAQYTPPTPE